MKRVSLLAVLASIGGCAAEKTGQQVEPSCCAPRDEPESAVPDEDDERDRAHCEKFQLGEEAEQEFTDAGKLLSECDEACMKSEGGAEKRGIALDRLRNLAEKGHLKAQSLLGRTQFGDLMTTGSEPEFEPHYVEAIHYLALAAGRGDADAKDYVPGLASISLREDGSLSGDLEPPLSDLDEGWLKRGLARAQADLPCFR